MKNRMRIDDIKVGEEYAAEVVWGVISRVRVVAIDKIDETPPWRRHSRQVRTPRVEVLDESLADRPDLNAKPTHHVPARDLRGPWAEVSVEMERKRAARADQREATERLASALADQFRGQGFTVRVDASSLPGRINVQLDLAAARDLAQALGG